ncbi:Xaa-Pro peptidase family protein [Mesorhizobium sp. M1423]|uniref:M24 family metallopeptidase n=1 Tax=Mesorhizobium sp. M1423 TaxID=2957101 RepID=UPI003335B0C3
MQFNRSEFQSRVERLRAELRTRKLDALFVDGFEASAYYLNYEAPQTFYPAGLIPTEGEPFFVLWSLDVPTMRESSWIEDVAGFSDWEDPAIAIARKIRQRGFDHARIGIDLRSHALTVQTFEALKRELPRVEFVDVDGLPWKLRKVKSVAEIEKLRRAAAISDATMHEIVEAVKPGVRGRDAARMAVDGYIRRGADAGPLGVINIAGPGVDDMGFLHGEDLDTPLKQGDVLHVELIPRFEGYSARMMRCVVVGDIPPALELASRQMIELQDKQIAAMKPGAIAKDVDRIMRQGALDARLRDHYTNFSGYTLGYYPERSRGSEVTWIFLPNSEWVLEEGMVFHMYTSGRGISISETVLVGPNGGERLTKLERRLFSSNAV